MAHVTLTDTKREMDPEEYFIGNTHRMILAFGQDGQAVLGAGAVLEICRRTEVDGTHVVRRVTSLSEFANNSIRIESFDGARYVCRVVGGTGTNLYIEGREQVELRRTM